MEKFINYDEFDWDSYYEKGKKRLKEELENNPEMWKNWTNSDKRYFLISKIKFIEEDIDKLSDRVSDYVDTKIGADSIEILDKLWDSKFYQQHYDTTTQHFIIDNQERKVIKFLSVCM